MPIRIQGAFMRIATVVAVILSVSSAIASGQKQQGDALLRAKERANMLTQFRTLLEHTDPATRMAAFEEAIATKDPALKTMAMDAAFSSTDDNLKTAALRVYLDGRTTLSISVLAPERMSDGLAKEHNRWVGLMIGEIAVKDNAITANGNVYEVVRGGQMIPGGFVLNFQKYSSGSRCSLTAKVVAAKQMAGNLECAHPTDWGKEIGANRTTFPVRIDLP